MSTYEFFYKEKSRHLEEVINTSRMGVLREKIYGLMIFISFNLILYIVFLVVSIVGTTSVLGTLNMDWFLHLAKAFFLYHFMTYLIAIFIGMAASFIPSRIKGFFALTILFATFSRIIYPIIMQCANSSEKWTHILDIFGIMNRNYSIYCDLVYNYTTEAVNLQRILFWIFLVITIILLVVHKNQKKILTIISFLSVCFVFFLYIQPSGERYIYGDWGTYMDEQQYYGLLYYDADSCEYSSASKYDDIGRMYKKADFQVKRIEGTLSPKRVLETSIDVYLDKTDLDEYNFTLYHGYVLERVEDQSGQMLDFEQDIDHIRIKSNEEKRLEKIHLEYKGYSRKYVATSQAMYLAGNFPYIPNAGWNEYMIEPINGAWQQGYNLKGAMYSIEYDFQIDTKLPIYSNLILKDGHYIGTSEGATFIASPFVKALKLKNCVVYYAIFSKAYGKNTIEETAKAYEAAVDRLMQKMKRKTKPLVIFDMVGIMDADISWYVAKDHMIAGPEDIEELYTYYKSNGCTIDHTKWDKDEAEEEGEN